MTISARPCMLAALSATMIALAPAAHAGDSAQLNVIGYSQDGKVFAFEEYGVFDGSGGPYSSYYFLHTETDKFLPGTPIKVKTDDQQSVSTIRAMARAKARPLIGQYSLEDYPGYVLTYNPASEVESDPHRVRYSGHVNAPPETQTYTMVLKEKPFPASKECLNMTGNYSGFRLAFTEADATPSERVIFEDQQVPASRNCPNGYRIGAVVTGDTGTAPMIAMIQVSSFGFEGNDQRWIAIPVSPFGQH